LDEVQPCGSEGPIDYYSEFIEEWDGPEYAKRSRMDLLVTLPKDLGVLRDWVSVPDLHGTGYEVQADEEVPHN